MNDIRTLVTLFSFLLFIVLAVWAWRPARKSDQEEAAQLPFCGEIEFREGMRHE